jgi:hypothetical protein
MAQEAGQDTDAVEAILAKHWSIDERAVRTDLGVSRRTWRVGARVGQGYWLSQCEEWRAAELAARAQLVEWLRCFISEERFSISVPDAVPAEDGRLVVRDGGYGWCLTRHLEGFHPDNSDAGIYPVITEGLASFIVSCAPFLSARPLTCPLESA